MEYVDANFLGLPAELAAVDNARALVLPLPLDLTASWGRGTAAGPAAIIAASRHLEWYDDELDLELPTAVGGLATWPEPMLPTAPADAADAIYELARTLLRDDRLMVSLGGEHAVSWPLVRAHHEVWKDLCVVQIDAHADMRDTYMDSKYNHACPMRRIMEDGVHVTSVGVRSMDAAERGFLHSDLSRIWRAHEVAGCLAERSAEIIERLPTGHVYLTVDLDGFDPSVCPAVGTPVPGGLGWYETLVFIRALAARRHVVGADVVELSPRQDLHLADAAAAKLVFKIIAYVLGDR